MSKTSFDDKIPTLHSAVDAGNEVVLSSLLNQIVEIDAFNAKGLTALHIACANGFPKIAEQLLKKGARVSIDCKPITSVTDPEVMIRGWKPLHFAVANGGNDETVQMLLNFNAEVDAVDVEGWSALHLASESGFVKIAKLLLERGANVNLARTVGYDKGRTSLHLAAMPGHKEVVKMLLSQDDIHVDAIDSMGWTALHVACQSEYPEIVKLLLENGANPNLKCTAKGRGSGFTPLHIISYAVKSETVDLLLEWGANINLVNEHGQTPLDCATEITKLFGMLVPVDIEIIDDDIRKHAMKRKVANLFVSGSNLNALEDDDEMEEFRLECEKEIKKLRAGRLGQSKVSFFDILAKPDNQVADYAENNDIVQVMKSNAYVVEFPAYARLIRGKFSQGERRANLLRRSAEGLHFAINKFIKFPDVCVKKIIRYLINQELMNIIRAKLTCVDGRNALVDAIDVCCEEVQKVSTLPLTS